MNLVDLVLYGLLILGVTLVFMVLLGAFARRVLGARIGIARVTVAGVFGLAAGVLIGIQVVWTPAGPEAGMIPIVLGLIGLVTIVTLVIAEFIVPQGSLPRIDQWPRLIREAIDRNRRYVNLLRISTRYRLYTIPLRRPLNPNQAQVQQDQASAVRLALEEAGGAFVKLGQLLSTRTDLLPDVYINELSKLQESVTAVPWEDIQPDLDASLGGHHSEFFTVFDHEPFASASIGQVHAATLPSGQRVAVKVRRPGIVPIFERDLNIATRLARRFARTSDAAAQFGIVEMMDSLVTSLRDELDFTLEAANMAALAEAQHTIPQEARVAVPGYVEHLSSNHVLVMDYVTGNTLSDADAIARLEPETRREMADRLLAAILAQLMEVGVFHSDLHPGNIIIDDNELVLLDFGSIGRIDAQTRSGLRDIVFAYGQRDAGAFTEAIMDFIDFNDVEDEAQLRRSIANFATRRLGPGAQLDIQIFGDVVKLLAEHGLTAPSELTMPFRAIATVEGSLRRLDPAFDLVVEARGYAQRRVKDATSPSSLVTSFNDQLFANRSLLKHLPQRIDRISGQLAEGSLKFQMRTLADSRDRRFLHQIIGLGVVTFLAGIFGIMAVVLLTSDTGPQVTEALTLFQLFGYLFLLLSGTLAMRALFEVLRPRPTTRT